METVSEDTKYKLKLDVPKQEPAFPVSEPTKNEPINDSPVDDEPMDSFDKEDKPFDDTPFDAGVEADEDEDPKKFLQQLAGKMQTSLRKFTNKEGQPDFELEKYIINSIISATHTSQMPEEDKKDIIKKIKDAGEGDEKIEKQDDVVDSELNDDNQEDEENIDNSEELNESDPSFQSDPYFQYSEEKSVWEMNDLLGEEYEQEEGHAYESTRYMFFSNLAQIRRQTELLMDFDEDMINSLLENGHDWAQDHIATAKESIDQVFDFIMNEVEDDGDDFEEWSKPMEVEPNTDMSDELKYHLDNKIALGETVFRYGSESYFNLINEVKSLYDNKLIKLNENDEFIVSHFDNKLYKNNGNVFRLNVIYEETENNSEIINEAKYKGKEVELGKPKRGGSKKFYVYVKNPETGKIKKVSFGAKAGGGKLAVKLKDAKARKAFADRHNCDQKNDKTTAGYWSCRLPKFAKLLGIKGAKGRYW